MCGRSSRRRRGVQLLHQDAPLSARQPVTAKRILVDVPGHEIGADRTDEGIEALVLAIWTAVERRCDDATRPESSEASSFRSRKPAEFSLLT